MKNGGITTNDKISENLNEYLDSKNDSLLSKNIYNNFKDVIIVILNDFIYIFININISS